MRRAVVIAMFLSGSVPMLAQQQVVTCNSSATHPRFCPADTRNGVILVQERSNGVCEQGTTWSYTPRGINVKGGCSADFQLGAPGNRNGSGANGYANGNGGYQNNYPNGQSNSNGNGSQGTGTSGSGGYGNNGYGDRRQAGVEIPAGTRLSVRMEQTVNTGSVNQGDLIPATIVNDVTVDGQVVVPSGTSVQAKVLSAQGNVLDVRLESLRVNGRRYQLNTSSVHDSRDIDRSQEGGNQSASKGIGALLGSIAGGGQLTSGSVYLFRLTSPARPSFDHR